MDAALAAGKITSEQAGKLRERIETASFCSGALRHTVRHGVRQMLAAAADYLGLTRSELREQLHGTSLAALGVKQGKTVEGLEAAMLAPARDRLAKAVAAGTITQAQAEQRLDKLEKLVERLVSKTLPAK